MNLILHKIRAAANNNVSRRESRRRDPRKDAKNT